MELSRRGFLAFVASLAATPVVANVSTTPSKDLDADLDKKIPAGTTGYQRLAGGALICWGRTDSDGMSSFPIAFASSSLLNAQVQPTDPSQVAYVTRLGWDHIRTSTPNTFYIVIGLLSQ